MTIDLLPVDLKSDHVASLGSLSLRARSEEGQDLIIDQGDEDGLGGRKAVHGKQEPTEGGLGQQAEAFCSIERLLVDGKVGCCAHVDATMEGSVAGGGRPD